MSKNFTIGVENFRVFKEMTEFDLRPLTILVGPNNSGKSSFTKLLLLLKNGFEKLDFSKGEHHLGSYQKALNWDLKAEDYEDMVIRNTAEYFLLPDSFKEEIKYNKSTEIVERRILNPNSGEELLGLKILPPYYLKNGEFRLNIKYFIDLLYSKKLILKCCDQFYDNKTDGIVNLDSQTPLKEFISNENKKSGYKYFRGINLSNYQQKTDLKESPINIVASIFINELSSVENKYLLYDLFINDEKIEDSDLLRKLQEFQDDAFSNYTGPKKDMSIFSTSFELNLNFINRNLSKYIKQALEQKISDHLGNDGKVNIQENKIGRLLFKEQLFPEHGFFGNKADFFFTKTLFEIFFNQTFTELNSLKKTVYIPANRGRQSRYFIENNGSDTYKWISKFAENRKNNDGGTPDRELFMFLKDGLSYLNIDLDDISVEKKESVCFVYLKKNGKKVNLADYGFGFSQLLPLIFEIYNALCVNRIYSGGFNLIIEEPEANIHPNLQSKLADILISVKKYRPNCKIIIETHSEYLIRKLQYLVAKQEIKREDCIIHYFNADENVSKEEPKVKPIEINEGGNLTDNFGPGFFDEATRLQFDLLKLNKNQSN